MIEITLLSLQMRQHNVKQLKQLEQRHKYSVEELRRTSERDLDTLRVSDERELEKFRQKLRDDRLSHERYFIKLLLTESCAVWYLYTNYKTLDDYFNCVLY